VPVEATINQPTKCNFTKLSQQYDLHPCIIPHQQQHKSTAMPDPSKVAAQAAAQGTVPTPYAYIPTLHARSLLINL
jgi:hypothetical protein